MLVWTGANGCVNWLFNCDTGDYHVDVFRYTDRVAVPAGRYVIGFNATARVNASSAAVAIDDVLLLEGSCHNQGSTAYTCYL